MKPVQPRADTPPARRRRPGTSPPGRERAVAKPAGLAESFAEGAIPRLISETAHDLRSPLTTIRESVRLVRDGEVGDVNEDQRWLLSAAIDQCDCVDQMVGEMTHLESLRSGIPRVNRRWVATGDVRASVEETLRPWTLPREISVLWDGADDPRSTVFADPDLLRRLLVNLITNALRVTKTGDSVLVRLQRCSGGERLRWCVGDRGPGIETPDLDRIARCGPASESGEGLGLAICRQLAALHFSTLRVRTRRGTGTEVSFTTPAAGPASVANAWAAWRVAQTASPQRPHRREDASGGDRVVRADELRELHASRVVHRTIHARIDPPTVVIELTHDGPGPSVRDRVVAGTVTLGAALPSAMAADFDRWLQRQQRLHDLVYRVETRRWVWILDTAPRDAESRIAEMAAQAAAELTNMRLHWSKPRVLPVEPRRLGLRVGDLMVRETLSASAAFGPRTVDEVRLGTAPLAESPVAAARLDQELRRLSLRLSDQSRRLRHQARQIRPE